MTTTSMDIFVRHLFEIEDFRSLTMRSIREKYEEAIGSELDDEQKQLLKEMVETIFTEKMNEEDEQQTKSNDSAETVEHSLKMKQRKRKQVETPECSDTDSGSNCSLPVKKKHKASYTEKSKPQKRDVKSNHKDDQSNNDSELDNTKNEDEKCYIKMNKIEHMSRTKATKTSRKKVIESDSSNSDTDIEEKQNILSESYAKSHCNIDEEEEGLSANKSKLSGIMTDNINDEKSSKKSKQKTSRKIKSSGSPKKVKKPEEKSKQLKHYEKIARACGVMPVGTKYKATFKCCTSETDRVEKLKQILRDAGMTGRISMEEAEKLKLRREAAELGADNIISTEGRSRRSVSSVFSNQEYKPISKEGSEIPLKQQLSKIKDIIDSDSD